MVTTSPPRTTGLDLRLQRVARQVTQTQIAAVLGVRPQAVSNVEALLRPTPAAIERYLSALERVSTQ